MSRPTRIVTCARCQRDRLHGGRGLCKPCYIACRSNGTLHDYPRRNYPRPDLIEDWEFLHRQGYTRAQAAERIGVTRKALEKAIERHNRAQEGAAA